MNPVVDGEAPLAVVQRILRLHCAVQRTATPQSRLAEDLGLDSVGMLTLAVELENHYRVKLGEAPEHPPRTVADVLALLELRLAEQGSAH